MKKLLFLLFITLLTNTVFAQLEVKKDSFKIVLGFENSNPNLQTDENNMPYAVLRVKTVNLNDKQRHELVFQSDESIFIKYEYRKSEVWVYLTYQAQHLKITHSELGTTEFRLPFRMEPKKGYEMTLVNKSHSNVNEDKLKSGNEGIAPTNSDLVGTQPEVVYLGQDYTKIFTFLTLNAACNNYGDWSYGLTVGNYKRFGWFVSVMTNFRFDALSTDYKCGNDLKIGNYYPDYTGKEVYSALSVMGGVIYNVLDPLAVRGGLGYGVRNTAYELGGGELVKNTDISATGIDISVGVQVKIKKFIVSLDAVTTNFKIFEAKIGLGYGVIR